MDGFKPVNKLVDEDALLVGEKRRHAGAFDFHRLIEKHDDDEGKTDGNEQVAGPDTDFVAKLVGRKQDFPEQTVSGRSALGKGSC